MSEVVSNTSPLIVLAKAGFLDLLPKLYQRVLIPEAVREEIMIGPADDPMKQALPSCLWLHVETLSPPLSPLGGMQLGVGESEAIELARRRGLEILLDDRAGRRTAESLRIRVTGTLGLIATAAHQKLLPSFAEAAQKVRSEGLFVSDDLINAIQANLDNRSK